MGSDIEALGESIAEQAAHLDAATHRLLTAVREFDSANGWYKQGARNCAEWLSWRVGWSTSTARDRVRVAQRLGELPVVDKALERGELSYCKVRAITRVATVENEAALVEMARASTGAQLDRICSKYAAVKRQGAVADPRNDAEERYLTRRDLDNGFVEIRARLHPEEAAAVWAALDRIVKERCHAPTRTDESTSGTADLATTVLTTADGVEVSAEPTGTLPAPALAPHASEEALRPGELALDSEPPVSAKALCEPGSLPGDREQRASAEMPSKPGSIPDPRAPAASAESIAAIDRSDYLTHPPASLTSRGTWTRTTRGTRYGRIDALVDLAQELLRGESPNRSPVELVVTVAADVLRDPANAVDPIGCLSDGTCVSAETVRRLSCDCGVVEMVEDQQGRPLSVGRKTRVIPASMKRALMRRDQHCRFPGCQNRLFVDGHHAKHWAEGGVTALGNLVTLCGYHHRFVHEYGYRVELDVDQVPHFFDERGRPVVDVPEPPPSEHRGWPTITWENRRLQLSADTPACGWNGEPVDYEWVIDALVSVDRERAATDDDVN